MWKSYSNDALVIAWFVTCNAVLGFSTVEQFVTCDTWLYFLIGKEFGGISTICDC